MTTALRIAAAGFVFACLCAAAAQEGESMDVDLELEKDVVTIRSQGLALPVSLRSPAIEFMNGQQAAPAVPASMEGGLSAGETLIAAYEPIALSEGVTLEVRLEAEFSDKENVLRKRVELRLQGNSEPWVLSAVTFDRFDAPEARFRPHAPQSYPVFLDGFFAGVEFPIATTRIEDGVAIISHAPGAKMRSGDWVESRTAVYGAAPAGREKEAFMDYIARHRPEPHDLHVNYNSWWTSGVPFTEEEILGLMGEFKENLYDPHGVALDTFAIDLGWSDPESIWEIDPEMFPEGFTNIQRAAAEMDCNLGLWISPTAFYGPGLDTQWAEDQGYETITIQWGENTVKLCCLGGPKYAEAFKERLADLVGRYDIRHVKLDGYYLTCDAEDHGHVPGPLSAEACAEGGIRAFKAMREANPHVWLETTCFGWNPSPWWLLYVNSVIGTFGDDSPYGRVPAPVYWESKTSARDYFNLQGAYHLPIPDVAQEVLGVIVQTNDPFLNDGVTTVMRGHMFLPLYVNPQRMNPLRWGRLAGLLTWARNNADRLQETVPLPPESWRKDRVPEFTNVEVMPREPYGYAHWHGTRGLVHLRNPWLAPASYPLQLNCDAGEVNVVSLYPEPRVYGESLAGDAAVDVPLAPGETVVLHIAPGAETEGLPQAHEAVNNALEAEVTVTDLVRVAFEGADDPHGPDWTNIASPEGGMGAQVRVAGSVSSAAEDTRLIVLLEGDATPQQPPATLKLNGESAPLEAGPSSSGWAASSIPPGGESWLFLQGPLPQGECSFEVEVLPQAVTQVSVWAWAAKKPGPDSDYPNALPKPELLYLDAVPLLPPTDVESIERKEMRPAVLERISGVFLDAIEPVSAEQGWGELKRNMAVTERPMTIGGQRYRRGLGTHAVSRIVYELDGETYATFVSDVGVDGGGSGSVEFVVRVDGEIYYKSGRMTAADAARRVEVGVTGAKELELYVSDAEDGIISDHANWAGARLLE